MSEEELDKFKRQAVEPVFEGTQIAGLKESIQRLVSAYEQALKDKERAEAENATHRYQASFQSLYEEAQLKLVAAQDRIKAMERVVDAP